MKYCVKYTTIVIILMVALFHNIESAAVTEISSGNLQPGEYLIKSEIIVPQDSTLRIAAGTKLFFEQFTGIKVKGKLYCEGTVDSPITFTSIKDFGNREEKAEAFDWNGVEISKESDTIIISNTKIKNSTYGVIIQDTVTRIKLENVEFTNIGDVTLSRKGEEIIIEDGKPFTMLWNIKSQGKGIEIKDSVNTAELNAQSETVNLIGKEEIKKNRFIITRISAASICLAGVSILIINSIDINRIEKAYEKATDSYKRNELQEKFEKRSAGQSFGIVLGAIGVNGFAMTFFF